jgi:O-antigen/teichoic acid export membrane protein
VSLKKNILINYTSQFYVTLIGIVMVPLYIEYMGAEAYGIVGFFAMLQAWFALLDMGLTPTIARETARFQGGATDVMSFLSLVRALEGVFIVVAILGGGILFAISDYISKDWLQVSTLPVSEVKVSIQLMSAIISLLWMCGLYRGVISGSERLVWLGCYNSVIATLRFVAVFPILLVFGPTPTIFFVFQLVVAIIEFLGLLIYGYCLFPTTPDGQRLHWEWAPLKPVLRFSLTIAFTSTVWVLVTQTDKLILSNILPLADYGYFTLAVLVSGGISIISGPISGAIMPRMTNLEAKGDHKGLIRVYRHSTQLIAVLTGSVATTVAYCAEPLLWAWTGDRHLAQQAAPILNLYALGNGVLAVAAFPYYLQYAKGDLRLHLIGNAIFVTLLIPSIIYAAVEYGGLGAGYVWLGMNLLSFAAWLPFVHAKFEPGLNFKWYVQDVLMILIPVMVVGNALHAFLPISDNRLLQGMGIFAMEMILLLVGVLSSSVMREKFKW